MKTTFTYDHYYLQEEIEAHVKALAEKYPDLFSYEYLLETPDKHHIIAATLTNKKTGAAEDKPAFHIDGNTHAGEVTGMMAAMHAMDYLLTNYETDEKVKFILDNLTVYIVPSVSPDGSQTYLSTPYTLRSVNRPYYDLKDGLQEKDMDGDDVIRMMRVKSPYGAWKKDPHDPALMIKREPDDVCGEFYNVYTEGEIDGFDGVNVKMKPMQWGRDFNRNYPYGWFPEKRQPGAGEYPLCNPETKAMAEFIINHKNIASVATNHTSGGILLMVPGTYPEAKAPAADMKLMRKIGEIGTAATGYKAINIFDSFTVDQDNYSSGAFDDYCYETQGIYAMTLELWDLDIRAGVQHFWDEDPKADNDAANFAKRMNWVKENAPEYFKDWTEYDHPQLGKVEIGGFNYKFTIQNPPQHLLTQECEKITAFMLRWAPIIPRLVIDDVKVTELGNDFYQLDAIVSNAGYLPTYLSDKAKHLGTAKPVTVSVDFADGIVNGTQEQEIGDLSSFGLCPTGVHFYGNISTANGGEISKKVTWIYQGKKDSITVTASTPKGGKVTKTVQL